MEEPGRRSHGIGPENRHRMAKGRPPRRWNPISGKHETAKIDLDGDTFDITWSTPGIDPFAREAASTDSPPDS